MLWRKGLRGRILVDAQALVGKLMAAGSVFAFPGEHRTDLIRSAGSDGCPVLDARSLGSSPRPGFCANARRNGLVGVLPALPCLLVSEPS